MSVLVLAPAAHRTPLPSLPLQLVRLTLRKPMGLLGAAIILVMILMALFAGVIAPYDPYELRSSMLFTPPGPEFPLGTDDYGRDVLSRIIYGARISLYVGIVSVLLGTTHGAAWGLVAGYLGGRTDFFVQRVMEALMAFPTLVLALAIVAALGQSTINIIVAVALVLTPTANRVMRSTVLSTRHLLYVEAARAVGCPDHHILLRHVLPSCLAPYIILASVALSTAILAEASLGFLGLGTPPPEPSWGSMLSGAAQQYVRRAPWMAIYPGLAISLAVFGFNMLGDAVRDILDPRLRGR
jgi:peptide/nickel transport system permease protein